MWSKIISYLQGNKEQMMKYGTVGLLSAVLDFGVLVTLTEYLKVYYLFSATISFVLAASLNYLLNHTWTFRSDGKHARQVPIFLLIAIIGLFFNNFILWLGVVWLHLYYVLAKVIATGVVTITNYLGNKYLTFRK